MSRIKIFCGVFAAAIIFLTSLCSAAEDSANAKLARIEIDTYGAEQTGALLDRISRLEKSFNGQNMTGNMNARIDAIYNALYDNSAGPCVLAKINALEWNLNHEVRSDGIDKRIEVLEVAILGQTTQGTFNQRIRELTKASFGEEILPVAQVQVPANLLIKVETTAAVSSKAMQEGDSLPFRVVDDVYVDGKLVFVRGLTGEGTIVKVVRAKNIFSNGKIETDFHTLKTIDGQNAVTFSGVEAIDEMKKFEMARGLSLNGYTFSGKNSGIEEVFIRGKNIELAAGIEMFVQIKQPIVVYGLNINGNGSTTLKPVTPAPQPVTGTQPPVIIEPTPQPVTGTQPPVIIEPMPQPVTETPTPTPPINEPPGLSDDEKIVMPPPVEQKPVETKPVEETKPAPQPVEQKPVEQKPVETKPVEETKPAPQPVEQKPVEETKPAPQPVEQKPVEQKPAPQPQPIGDDVEIIEIYDE